VLAFGDSDEDAQVLEGQAVIVIAKVRGQARHSSTISTPAPTRQAARTDWGLHEPGCGVTDSAEATTRSLGWDEAIWDDSQLAPGIIMRAFRRVMVEAA
jgi:hypothetical protein